MSLYRFLVILLGVTFASELYARPVSVDSRIKYVTYGENAVYDLHVKYGVEVCVEFANGEYVDHGSIPTLFSHLVNIKPPRQNELCFDGISQQDKSFNMRLYTNKRKYMFNIHTGGRGDGFDRDLLYLVRFVYRDDEDLDYSDMKKGFNREFFVIDNYEPNENIVFVKDITGCENYDYDITGDEEVKPLSVCSNGDYTILDLVSVEDNRLPYVLKVYDDDTIDDITDVIRTDDNRMLVKGEHARLLLYNKEKSAMLVNKKKVHNR